MVVGCGDGAFLEQTVYSMPCSQFIQIEMPIELTAILLKAIP